jgi:glutaminyl-tRNA synthetase
MTAHRQKPRPRGVRGAAPSGYQMTTDTVAGGGVDASATSGLDFVRQIVAEDRQAGKHQGRVHTRFPPEPNGFLHIGHAKSMCLNFGLAAEHGGVCNLRMDDTNPTTESVEYVRAIEDDVRWLGFDWGDRFVHASDYFDQLYDFALELIRAGHAYVCDLRGSEVSEYRGLWNEPGRNSPNRDRTVEENLGLFARMRAGEFEDGARSLRAKIDMASPNMNMRDPAIYRIRRVPHYRTGNTWCIYPMYDFTHPLSDALEGITHSLCTLEFEDHRPLYDWFLQHVAVPCQPQQIEFARLNLSYTVLSKRKLLELVDEGHVAGWDDPRMPTLVGLRRRGYTPAAIRDFCDRIGVAKSNSRIAVAQLEDSVRQDLNQRVPRVLGVLRPVKVVIENYPEGQVEHLEAVNNPEDETMGTRQLPFSRELYIEQSDFREDPPKKYFRLARGREVRLRYAYFITCREAVKDSETGEVVELRCTYDPETRGGYAPDGRKVRGTIHWVSAAHAVQAEVRLYDHLFAKLNPEDVDEGGDYKDALNPSSLETLPRCQVEPSLVGAEPGSRYQFERTGYFCVDADSSEGRLVVNRTVTLRDAWARIEKAQADGKHAT